NAANLSCHDNPAAGNAQHHGFFSGQIFQLIGKEPACLLPVSKCLVAMGNYAYDIPPLLKTY
ncbi:MAG: hypothetical protein PHI60_08205, partial [Candidatus Omnitrophica bacterium]|nr:hypothetical protein [Candidatus Omnitrophota bacterium]